MIFYLLKYDKMSTEKELTAMQEMMGWLTRQRDICIKLGNREESETLNGHISVAQSLLQKEKSQIIDAYNQGYRDAENAAGGVIYAKDVSDCEDAKLYFNGKYKQ